MNEIKTGQIIDGKYQIQAVLGSGAFGAVYKAYHDELSRVVAIKVLGVRGDLSEDTRSRFAREARLLSSLNHPNVISVYSFGLLENSFPYIAMEYLDGRTLAARLQDDEPFPQNVLLEIFMQACRGISAAHDAGIIHRDLKPENIFLANSDGSGPGFVVKILDFGLSRQFVDGLSTSQRLTQTGALLGSVHYMSPEAAGGHPVDQRSDIYSLACILYQCVAGTAPYDADTPLGILYKQQNEKLPDISSKRLEQAPKGIDLVIEKALEKEPSARFQNATEFMDALLAVKAQDIPLLSSLCERQIGAGARNKKGGNLIIVLVATSFVAVLALLGFLSFKRDKPSNSRTTVLPSGSSHNAKIRSADLLTLRSRFEKAHSDRFNLEIVSADNELRNVERELADVQPHLRTKPKLVDCLILRSNCLRDLGDAKGAAELLEQAVKESVLPSGEFPTEVIGIRTNLAEQKMALGQAAEAEKLALENLRLVAKIEDSYRKDEETPELKTTMALEIGLSTALSRSLLANLEYERKNYKKAMEYAEPSAFFMEGRGIMDGANSMRFLIGNCYYAMNQPDAAMKEVAKFADKLGTYESYRDEYLSGRTSKSHVLNCVHTIEGISYWFAAKGYKEEAERNAKLAKDLRELVGKPLPKK